MAKQKHPKFKAHTFMSVRNRTSVVHVTDYGDFIEVVGENEHGKYQASFTPRERKEAETMARSIAQGAEIE